MLGMRLIDADELRKLFKEEYKRTKQMINDGQTHLDTLAEGYTEAYHIVRYKALTVDAVPVVRCKDCKHMHRDNVGVFCRVWGGYNGEGENGFCNYGELADMFILQERRWMETI